MPPNEASEPVAKRPNQAETPEELLVALINSTDELPTVKIAVLVEALGLEAARKLTVIQLDAFVDRSRAIEMLMLNRAVGMLSVADRAALNPIPTVEIADADDSSVKKSSTLG